MGFVQWRKCLSEPMQLLRLILMIIILCIAFYQLSECFRKIIRPPVSTHYSFHLNESLIYPALTICRIPPFKTSVFDKYGLVLGGPRFSNSWQHFKFENFTVDEFFEEATYTLSEVMPFYGFDQYNTDVTVESFFLLEHGRCFTLTPKNELTRWNSIGYFLYMSHTEMVRKVTQSGISTSGFNIHIHDRRDVYSGDLENCDSFMDYIYMEAGEEIRVNLKLQVYSQLPTNSHRCDNSLTYSKSRCRRECLHRSITNLIGCSAPWVPNSDLPSCNTHQQMRQLIDEYVINYSVHSSSCFCPRSCNLRVYTPYIQARKDVELPVSRFLISFSSNLITIMEEIIGYDWNLFLADLGGSLGFLLGISVLGAISSLEHMYRMVLAKKNEKVRVDVTNDDLQKTTENNNVELYLNDKKLIDDMVSQHRKKIYDPQNDERNFIEQKY